MDSRLRGNDVRPKTLLDCGRTVFSFTLLRVCHMKINPISQFSICVEGNPYFVVRQANAYRMRLGFVNFEGLAMLCNAAVGANIADNLCYGDRAEDPAEPAKAADFVMHLSGFSADAQIIYCIHLSWSLIKRGWNCEAVQACEQALQKRLSVIESGLIE
jgi:hypothetical protein